ncbi:MAG: UvrD-helicase domain-containing protein [Bacteroidaceae bacterium]|nr:UvrD-helicase domain-containing protein [Bacteroidaceae bacterium]
MNPRFLLFKASAGSGKTFNLALQYIALMLAHGEHEFRHTLAVTFTNKATAEMKNRILQFLYGFWKAEPRAAKAFDACKKVLSEEYGEHLIDEEIRERSHRALKAILHDYSRFYVSTIDAFFQTVLRNMAHELGLNARLQVDLDDKNVIEVAVENLIEGLRHNDREVLPWLQEYIEQQLEEGNKSWDVRGKLKDTARLLFTEAYLKRSLDDHNKPFNIENISQFKKILDEERNALLCLLQEEAKAFDEELHRSGMGYEELCNRSNYVQGYIQKLSNGDFGVNFNSYLQEMTDDYQKLLKTPLRKNASLYPIAQNLSERLGQLHERQTQVAPRINSIDLALKNLTPMGLLGAIDAEVTRLSNERNRFMLARTPIVIKRMIQGDDASFVFERAGIRYNNIMIDEFQDTSRLQWENFRTLLLDNLASGGLNMIVGDIKQSIYRWRNGDWKILHELQRQGYNGIPFTEKPLSNNFRSLGNIVNFNNRFFPVAAAALDTLDPSAQIRMTNLYHEKEVEQHIRRDANSGLVRIRLCHAKGKEAAEAWEQGMLADLCQQVRNLNQQGVPYSQMAILLRKSRYIEPTITYFAEHMPEVQLVSNEAFLLGSSVAVQMLVNALQVVDDPERDPVALRYLAKHYLCDIEHREAKENDFCLDDYRTILPEDFIGHLDELRNQPLYELCEHLFRLLRLDEIKLQEAYLFTFFDELSNFLRENPSDIPTFLQYWKDTMNRVAIPNSEVDGIRIYTIHKSKGLAFHTVLMPYADWNIEKDMDDLYWCEPQSEPLNSMGTLPIKFTSRVKDSEFGAYYLEEHANRRADELNTLYVAFTRAEANLLVWGLSQHELEPGKFEETVADLMHACLKDIKGVGIREEESDITTYTVGTYPVAAQEESTQKTVLVQMRSYEGRFTFRQSSQAAKFIHRANNEDTESTTNQDYIEQGKLLHFIFSQIETADDIERVTQGFVQQGILKSDKQLKQVRDLAQRGLRHEQVRKWFSGKYHLFNECNILVPNPDGGKLMIRRPDRVMMDSQHIIIVDFKFGMPKPEYREQVAEYIRILQTMHPEKKVEGWLWYVYRNQVEEVKS